MVKKVKKCVDGDERHAPGIQDEHQGDGVQVGRNQPLRRTLLFHPPRALIKFKLENKVPKKQIARECGGFS